MKKVKIGKYTFANDQFKTVSAQAKDFIDKLLTYDPEKRPSAEQMLQHPWLTDMLKSTHVDETLAQGALANLKNFRADYKLKQATYAYIASQLLNKGERENLSKIFIAIDKNGDGKLSKEEIVDGYALYFGKHLNDEDVEQLFDSVDIDKSGYIDYSEFVVASLNEKTILTNEKLLAAFKMFDKDGSGFISAEEIKGALGFGQNLSIESVQEMMRQVDENGDGQISFDEFSLMMKQLAI